MAGTLARSVVVIGLLLSPITARADDAPNCGYYTNSAGHVVPRPCGDWHNSGPPQGATAKCRDGTYGFSEHHSGTCSGHGGVAEFLR